MASSSILTGGKLLKVVDVYKTLPNQVTASSNFVDVSGVSIAFKPENVGSKVIVQFEFSASCGDSTILTLGQFEVYDATTGASLAVCSMSNTNNTFDSVRIPMSITASYIANTDTERGLKLRFRRSEGNGSIYINPNTNDTARIIVWEVEND